MRGLIPDKTKAEVFNRLRIFDVRSAIAGRGHARSHFLEQDSPDFCDEGRLSLLPRLRIFDVRSAIAGRGHARSHFLEQDSPDFCGTWLYNEGRLSLLPWHTAKARVMADEEVQRRHRFNDFTESQQQTLVAAAVPQKTKQATDFWWGVFESFCREKMRLRRCEDYFCFCFGRCFEKLLRRTNDEERRNIPGNQLFVSPSGHTTEGHCRYPTLQLASRQRVPGEQHRPRRGSEAQQSEWSSEAEKTQGRYHRLGQGQTCEVLRRSFGKPGHATASGVLLVQPGTTPGSSRDGGFREDQQDGRRLQDGRARTRIRHTFS